MGDEEKKQRNRMTADELLEDTTQSAGKVIELMASSGLHEDSSAHLTQLIGASQWFDGLQLAQDLSLTLPYLDHAKLTELLLDTWEAVAQIKLNTRKNCYRKVRVLEADQKTDPEVLERWLGDRSKAEKESAFANISYIKVKEMIRIREAKAQAQAQALEAPPQPEEPEAAAPESAAVVAQ
ncbi:unnamed protein product [Chrysoparadoxa australica]